MSLASGACSCTVSTNIHGSTGCDTCANFIENCKTCKAGAAGVNPTCDACEDDYEANSDKTTCTKKTSGGGSKDSNNSSILVFTIAILALFIVFV
jgi:hypothetical protein